MTVDVTELLKIKDGIDLVRTRMKSDEKFICERLIKLQKECQHPTVKVNRKYFSGGYDYVSSVVVTKTCTLCEKVLESYDDPNHKGCHG